jgi:hypothetical protein
MNKTLLLFAALLFVNYSFSQNIFYDNISTLNIGKFDGQGSYSSASPSQGNGTGACAGIGCLNVQVVAKSMTYPNFGTSSKAFNPVDGVLATGDGPGKSLGTPITSGSVYVALLVNLNEPLANSSSNKQIVRLMDNGFTTAARIYVKRFSGGSFQVGVDKNGSAVNFGTATYSFGQDHLFILKYQYIGGSTTNDVASVFVDPDMSLPEPTPIASVTGSADATTITRIAFPWNSSSILPNGYVGIVSTAKDWANIESLPSTTIDIAGRTISPNKSLINTAKVLIKNSTIKDSVWSSNGSYLISNLQPNSYTLKPTKNNDVNKSNGVSGTDALLVQRHILGTNKLNSAYKIIAADVNGDKTINSIDVLRIKRLILGSDTTFLSTTRGSRLWDFVDSAYVFADTTNPFPFKDSISYANVSTSQTNQTFIGIKLGDVNYDWNPSVARSAKANKVELLARNIIQNNHTIRVPITVANFNKIAALQYTLNFNYTQYKLVDIIPSNEWKDMEYNTKQANNNGNIAMLWIDKNGLSKTLNNGTVLFTVVFEAVGITHSNHLNLNLNNSITNIEAVQEDLQQVSIALITEQQIANKNTLTISPNPAKNNLQLQINASENKETTIQIVDMWGRIVNASKHQISMSLNTISINISSLSKGMYFVKLDNLIKPATKFVKE